MRVSARNAPITESPEVDSLQTLPHDDDAWYLVVRDQYEEEYCESWFVKNMPDLDQEQIINLLPIDRMHKKSKLYIVCRKGKRGAHRGQVAPVEKLVGYDKNGYKISERLPIEEVAEQVGVYGPIEAKDFWEERGRYQKGVNFEAFTNKVAEVARPYRIAFDDANAKKNMLPSMLYLTV